MIRSINFPFSITPSRRPGRADRVAQTGNSTNIGPFVHIIYNLNNLPAGIQGKNT
jgi:hypothetical protein